MQFLGSKYIIFITFFNNCKGFTAENMTNYKIYNQQESSLMDMKGGKKF